MNIDSVKDLSIPALGPWVDELILNRLSSEEILFETLTLVKDKLHWWNVLCLLNGCQLLVNYELQYDLYVR